MNEFDSYSITLNEWGKAIIVLKTKVFYYPLKAFKMRQSRHFHLQTGGESYTHTRQFKTNSRKFTGGKPYTRNPCPNAVSLDSNLKIHLRAHIDEKPFNCNKFQKDFSQAGSLNKNMRIHIGEKPYTCNQCYIAFSETGSLKIHL